jgi:hypothetical protein
MTPVHRVATALLVLLLATPAWAQSPSVTTLTADATATATTFTVASTAAMAFNHIVFTDREASTVVLVTSPTTVTVRRDKGGIASAHRNGSIVYSGPPTSFSREDPLSKSCALGQAANPYINIDAGTIWTCTTNGIWVANGQSGPVGAVLQGNGTGKPWTFTTNSAQGNVPAGGTAGQVLASTGSSSGWSGRPVLEGVLFPYTAPSAPADGTVWVEVGGTSPTRVATLKFQDGGVTRTLFSVTY